MIVVSNTSPIINLAAIGKLEILQKLYEKIFIPQAVHYEISIARKGKPGALEIEKLEWIEVKEVTNHKLVKALQMELDEGEAEAITLAIGLKSELLLLDEPQGRKVASNLGLKFIGLLGVLIEAKRKGIIPSVKSIMDALMTKAGFWISHQLYTHVLKVTGE